MTDTFRALLIDKQVDRQTVTLTDLPVDRLPEGDVSLRVEASTINFKDALVLSGKMPLVQSFPMVPGIDLAGVVEHSTHAKWKTGDRVIANGFGLGERQWGGYATKARLNGDWLVACPDAFTTHQAMAIGTAGYTAMLCVLALERHGVTPASGEVLVTGASGGVGSIAIAVLHRLGYQVTAATGRAEEADYLKALGASAIVPRADLASPGAPLQAERWAAAIDTAGSHTLANICASLRYGGTVAATGIAQGVDFPATMFPLALRGITICGVDSVMAPLALREMAWKRLASDLDTGLLEHMTSTVSLDEVEAKANSLLSGGTRGRIVVAI